MQAAPPSFIKQEIYRHQDFTHVATFSCHLLSQNKKTEKLS